MGHATRSKAVIDHLKGNHDIHVTAGVGAYRYLSRHVDNITELDGLHLWYRNNKLRPYYSAFRNLLRIKTNIQSLIKTKRIIKEFKPDVIISDFTWSATWLARWFNIPLITVDNNRLLAKCWVSYPFRFALGRWNAMFAAYAIQPKSKFHIVTTFFRPPIHARYENVVLVDVPQRKEVIRHTPKNGGHILVYQTHTGDENLFHELQHIDRPFIVYGTDKVGKQKNLHFKPFSEEPFFQDLASADAVIMNGSLLLMSEALYFKKPVLSLPVKGQFEQELNALYLDRLGYGMFSEELSRRSIEAFFTNAKKYENNLKSFNPDLQACFKELDKQLRKLDV
jgi:uncharacterized protein (TIGR00661 family)